MPIWHVATAQDGQLAWPRKSPEPKEVSLEAGEGHTCWKGASGGGLSEILQTSWGTPLVVATVMGRRD